MSHANPIQRALGEVYHQGRDVPSDYGQTVLLEGAEMWFDNEAPSAARVLTERDQRKRRAIFIRNTRGSALLPGAIVTWEALFHGRRVDGLSSATNEFAGVVDPNLPTAGVRDNDMFWLGVEGPWLVNKASTDTYSDGDFCATGNSGEIVTAATIDVDGSHVGRLMAAAANPSAQVLVYLKASHS